MPELKINCTDRARLTSLLEEATTIAESIEDKGGLPPRSLRRALNDMRLRYLFETIEGNDQSQLSPGVYFVKSLTHSETIRVEQNEKVVTKKGYLYMYLGNPR